MYNSTGEVSCADLRVCTFDWAGTHHFPDFLQPHLNRERKGRSAEEAVRVGGAVAVAVAVADADADAEGLGESILSAPSMDCGSVSPHNTKGSGLFCTTLFPVRY